MHLYPHTIEKYSDNFGIYVEKLSINGGQHRFLSHDLQGLDFHWFNAMSLTAAIYAPGIPRKEVEFTVNLSSETAMISCRKMIDPYSK